MTRLGARACDKVVAWRVLLWVLYHETEKLKFVFIWEKMHTKNHFSIHCVIKQPAPRGWRWRLPPPYSH